MRRPSRTSSPKINHQITSRNMQNGGQQMKGRMDCCNVNNQNGFSKCALFYSLLKCRFSCQNETSWLNKVDLNLNLPGCK